MEQYDISVIVNGQKVRRRVSARQHLIDFLRLDLSLTGSHLGCEHGICGACTIRVNGIAVRGCLMLAVQADGATVDTIEGLSDSGAIAELQDAFHKHNALQCGFCTSGMLATAAELIERHPDANREAIRAYISGNYCRCTGYHSIVDAIASVLEARRGHRSAGGAA